MTHKVDSGYRIQIDAGEHRSQVARDLSRPSPAQTPNARRNRTLKVERVGAINASFKTLGLAAKVIDDFPDSIPVLPRELDVIETYLATLLEEAPAEECNR